MTPDRAWSEARQPIWLGPGNKPATPWPGPPAIHLHSRYKGPGIYSGDDRFLLHLSPWRQPRLLSPPGIYSAWQMAPGMIPSSSIDSPSSWVSNHMPHTLWHNHMEMLSTLLALCEGKPLAHKGKVIWSFVVLFDLAWACCWTNS